jgi:hypothetical protein
MSIFVSIAAYRDPELAPTLRDCIAHARYPQELRFGICWQHADDEAPPPDFADPRLRVIDIPWRDSRGACWARAEIMKLWNGEEFFLQLDSHHRFVPHWDALLMAQAERCGAAKPLLGTYAAAFDPRAGAPQAGEPTQIVFDRFGEDGIPVLSPRIIPDWPGLPRPPRARFVAAGFLFAPGRFVEDVPYDPELYFHGEEITLAIRAFTHGYELFHPAVHVLWHEYTRIYRPKHWDDHVRSRGVDVEWHLRDAASLAKVRRFLHGPHVGPFGCGAERSVAEYEAYAGLSFRHRCAQDYTLRGEEPPNPPMPPNWATAMHDWHVRIVLERSALPPAALTDAPFWYVGFHDAAAAEIYREDAQREELRRLLQGGAAQIVIERRFRAARQPASWTVWPFSRGGGWLEKAVGKAEPNSLPANASHGEVCTCERSNGQTEPLLSIIDEPGPFCKS